MLNIVYFSNVSNNTRRFVENLKWEGGLYQIPIIGKFDIALLSSYVLVVPSYGSELNDHIPPQVKKFLNDSANRKHCVGVIGTGNINFGEDYAAAGDMISAKLHVPLLYKLELSGTAKDIEKVRLGLQEFGVAGCHTKPISTK